jgi:RNA polymerase sigma factor (sigma-70 family)
LTRNLSLDKIKSKHRRTEEIGDALQLRDSLSTPYAATESADTVGKIKSLMAELPEKQRLVMHLRDIEDMSYDEIAESLEMPLAQVKVNLHRARTKIREAFLAENDFLNLE